MRTNAPSPTGWHRPVQLACGLLLAGLLTGCVDTKIVYLTLAPRIELPLKQPAPASLEVAPVADSRPQMKSLGWILLYVYNGDGELERAYVAEKPVAETFGNGLNAALKQNGFEGTNGTRYLLQSEILSFNFAPSSFTRDFLRRPPLVLQVDFQLRDRTNAPPVWEKTCFGQQAKGMSLWSKKIEPAFTEAAEDAIRQLISDPKFRGFFELQTTNAP